MTNPICAICQQELKECTENIHTNCECKETFSCCNNSFHISCVNKLYDSKIISQLTKIAKCPLCRNYVDKYTKETLTKDQYLEELEESLIDYDVQNMAFKEKINESHEKEEKLINLCDSIMENNNSRILEMIEIHAKDMENANIARERLSNNLKRAVDSMKILLDENRKSEIKISILEAEKKGLEDLVVYRKNKLYNEKHIIEKLIPEQNNKEIQTNITENNFEESVSC